MTNKLTHAEAGKLGAARSKIICAEKYAERIATYNMSPTLCTHCNCVIEYKHRKNRFCNKSCATKFNNAVTDVEWFCKSCNLSHKSRPHRVRNFCNQSCQLEYDYKEKIRNWDICSPPIGAIKKYLSETYGYKCDVCSISEWNNKDIVLELEHKDGNSENNAKENLCLICPNCHSQTSTYKGKNKGNGRHSRRTRYKEGKSF